MSCGSSAAPWESLATIHVRLRRLGLRLVADGGTSLSRRNVHPSVGGGTLFAHLPPPRRHRPAVLTASSTAAQKSTRVRGRRRREARRPVLLLARTAQAALDRVAAGWLPLRRLRPRRLSQGRLAGRPCQVASYAPTPCSSPAIVALCAAHGTITRGTGRRARAPAPARLERFRGCGVDGWPIA
jgi:hypothetical protein